MKPRRLDAARTWLPCLLATLSACAIALAIAASAQAVPPDCEDPADCPPQEIPHTATLTVTAPSSGVVTGPGISCAGDCSQPFAWTETCWDFGQQRTCEDTEVQDPQLFASGGPSGYSPTWSGCTSAAGATCTVHMNADRTVAVTWTDTTAPTVGFASAPGKAGPSTVFTAGASDNAGVQQVDFYVDDTLRGTDGGAPFTFAPSMALYADGSSHVLKAIARDGAGNASSSLASAPARSFTIDKSTGPSAVSTPAAFSSSAQAVTFSVPADATATTCTTKLGASVTGTTPSCSSPYAPQLGPGPTDGQYTIELRVQDDVGNAETVTRQFTLDRGAPNLSIGSPSEGAVVGAPFTPATTVSDGFTPAGQNLVECALDAGPMGSCAALGPADGPHALTVRATDLAGNTTSRSVAITYDSTAPVVAITGGPAEGSVVYARGASFDFTASDLTALTTTCKLDAGAFGPCTRAGGHDLGDLSLGIHDFVVRSEDATGKFTEDRRRFAVSDLPTTGGGESGEGGVVVTQVIPARVSNFWALFGRKTRVTRLVVRDAPLGATVTVRCKGKGCAFKRVVRRVTASEVSLAKLFKKRKLGPGTVITIVVAKEGMVSRTYRYTTRSRKFPKLKQA